MKTFGLIF